MSIIKLFGKLWDIGHPALLSSDVGGFNGYSTKPSKAVSVDRKTGEKITTTIRGRRYGAKRQPSDISRIIIHHTGGFRAARAFQTLHNERGLSVHFIIDDDPDATIYQCLDVDVVAWHAGTANASSIGIEVALFPDAQDYPNAYSEVAQSRLGVQPHRGDCDPVTRRQVFIFTDAQMEALARLCGLIGDYLGWGGTVKEGLAFHDNAYHGGWKKHFGIMGHRHVCASKVDPAAMGWYVLEHLIEAKI